MSALEELRDRKPLWWCSEGYMTYVEADHLIDAILDHLNPPEPVESIPLDEDAARERMNTLRQKIDSLREGVE